MSTADLIMAARPSLLRPDWCSKENLGERVIGTLYEPARGELTLVAVARILDEHATSRGWVVGEVARVRKGEFEAVYARPAQEPPETAV